jgi:hypothetical protein
MRSAQAIALSNPDRSERRSWLENGVVAHRLRVENRYMPGIPFKNNGLLKAKPVELS